MTLYRTFLLAATLLAASPAFSSSSQESEESAHTAASAKPDLLAEAHEAAARGDSAEALSRYLRALATAPDDVDALDGAGTAALKVGDLNAATGFFARADALDPHNGKAKAGLARTMLQNGNARGALRLFHDAVDLGVPVASILADRGLAYDLRGSPRRAQADYQLALKNQPDDAVTTRRLALSQAISGDRAAAMATLDPLLRKQSVPAWRARAFVFALTGDTEQAVAGAALVMPANQVAELRPYLGRLAGLKAAQKAAAIHLGRFPGEGTSAAQTAAARSAAPRIPIDRAALTATAAGPQPTAPAGGPTTTVAPEPREDARTAARERAAARAKSAAEERAKKKREEAAEARAAAKKNPARHWVQVAGGANKNDLDKAWDKLKDKWPKQLAGRSPWTTHYRYTNRLLIGPFPSSSAAQAWVTKSAHDGFKTFRVETKAGDPVERVH